jgi:ParB/RepB/Spo0J family partition protein
VHSVTGVDAILVSPFHCFFSEKTITDRFVIVDGEHRWRAAKELGWQEIRCEIVDISEDDAKALCYRRNRERGTIDPFKEAALFKSEMPKLTQKAIAEKYLVDPSTVSQRLSLLKLDSSVKEAVEKFPRGNLTVSHLEPIASLPEGEQKKIQLTAWNGEVRSVREIEAEVKRVKEDLAEQLDLKKALETAEFPKCPKCRKGEPGRISHKGLPFVKCAKCYNDWSLETGRSPYEVEVPTQQGVDGKEAEAPKLIGTIRCAHTVEELTRAFFERARDLLPQTEITNIQFHGKLNGATFGIEVGGSGNSLSVSANQAGVWIHFRVEKKEYRTGEKSAILLGFGAEEKEVKRIERFVESAFGDKLEFSKKKGPNFEEDEKEEFYGVKTMRTSQEKPWAGVCCSRCFVAKSDKTKCKCKCHGAHHGIGRRVKTEIDPQDTQTAPGMARKLGMAEAANHD